VLPNDALPYMPRREGALALDRCGRRSMRWIRWRKQALIEGLVATIGQDNQVTVGEAELLRDDLCVPALSVAADVGPRLRERVAEPSSCGIACHQNGAAAARSLKATLLRKSSRSAMWPSTRRPLRTTLCVARHLCLSGFVAR
jgi:hypothetical protein